MLEANYRLGEWCPLWLRGWVLHWWSSDSPTPAVVDRCVAGKIMLLWHYRGKRQKTYVYTAFSTNGELLTSGSSLTLSEAKVRISEALSATPPATA
jgi:hypothetical protein